MSRLIDRYTPGAPQAAEIKVGPVAPIDPDKDSLLVERAKTDLKAFGVLYELHVGRIYTYIYYRVGNQQDAEDLTARTFHKALENIKHYNNKGAPFRAWLFRIAHNLVANWHRDGARRKVLSLDVAPERVPDVGISPQKHAEASEVRAALLAAFKRLPSDRQQLLLLKFTEAMPNAQIGKLMGRSEGAIKSLYHRTLIALREDLETRGLL